MRKISWRGIELTLSDDMKWARMAKEAQKELENQVRRGLVRPVVLDPTGRVLDGEEVVEAAVRAKVKDLTCVIVTTWSGNGSASKPVEVDSQESGAPIGELPPALAVTQDQCQAWAAAQAPETKTDWQGLDRFCVYVQKHAQLKRALTALRNVDPKVLPNRKTTVRGLAHLAKEQEAAALRRAVPCALQLPQVQVWYGDFRTLGARIDDNSADGVETDPPYDHASVDLYRESAILARRILKAGGLYIAYAGKMFLPEVYAVLETSGLEYVWQGAVAHHGGHNVTWPRRMISGYKPILIYRKPGGGKISWPPFLDLCTEGKQEQGLHPWQQAQRESEYFLTKLFTPGSLIVDPMAGSGTVLVAAMACGMNAIGIEIDPVTFEVAKQRVEHYLAMRSALTPTSGVAGGQGA